ncbi:MAG TPA: hypothetical protein VE007_09470 [Thermoanaerobaculia bacterium]|nr:hypothetical protein [Thermoanaerobaculia bacterium]
MLQSTLQMAAETARMPENAPLAALALLGTAGAVVGALVAAAVCAAVGRRTLATWIAAGAGALLIAYAGTLGGFAVASSERVLAPGGRKYFCELDCHTAVSVERVDTARVLGPPPEAQRAAGRFLLARVRTWFDPSTIAPWRGDALLTPNPRTAWIVDASGRRYPLSLEATRAAARAGFPSDGLDRPLRPGQSSTTTLVFDLPDGAAHPRLFVGDPPGVELVVIGHENTPLHRKILFDLGL